MNPSDFEHSGRDTGPLLGEHLNRYWAPFLGLGALIVLGSAIIGDSFRTTGVVFMAGGLGGLISGWVSQLRHARRREDTPTVVLFGVFIAVAIPAYFMVASAAESFAAAISAGG